MTDKSMNIKGKIYFARVHMPFDDGNYAVAIVPENPKAMKALADMGVPIKKKNESIPEDYVNASSKLTPTIVDADLKTIPPSILIGNGSIGIVKAHAFKYTPKQKGQTGVKLTLEAMQVIDLVRYENKVEGFEKQKGYKVDSEDDTQKAALNDEATRAVHSWDTDDQDSPF